MGDLLKIELEPAGVSLQVERGCQLRSPLAAHGVEMPCGGTERCGACRVRVLRGHAAVSADDAAVFPGDELNAGWRLACHLRAEEPMSVDVDQWDMPILFDEEPGPESASVGLGIAIDLGTTTIAAQLVDLRSGEVLGVRTLLNPQSAYGSDVMSRVQYALQSDQLTRIIRETLGGVANELIRGKEAELAQVLLVGNTVMHHIFCGLPIEPLARVPFHSPHLGEQNFTPAELGWRLSSMTRVRFLPAIGGFVGSDILAGIAAVGLHRGASLRGLVDLGTNGEIAIGNDTRILCASAAAGTAFEAANISMGMRAAMGAISHVTLHDGILCCSVVGGAEPSGLCGSGLVDAAACLLERGDILPSGRFRHKERTFSIAGEIGISQADVRELQLAKGAIAAGLEILLDRWGAQLSDLETVYLCGAFGNYIRVESAQRIGLLPVCIGRIRPSGNAALRGARLLLIRDSSDILRLCEHVSLAADPHFQNIFTGNLPFPSSASFRDMPDMQASKTASVTCA